ncbi:MAG: AAA family ATPase [Ginsengibacter sp.]
MVIIVFGLPGSGKSYFAGRLAKMISAGYLSSDRIRKEMYKKRTYSDAEKEAVYKEMLTKMKKAVHENRHVVLDGTFHKSETRKVFIEAMKNKSGVEFIEVETGENIARERLKKSRTYSEADFEIYKIIRDHFDPLTEPHLLLQSTNNNIENMLQQATFYLKWKHDNTPGK